ncbi:hypothetical protein [Peribacillus muralis]|nr:hypothetical protein [Peribacillus muralis]
MALIVKIVGLKRKYLRSIGAAPLKASLEGKSTAPYYFVNSNKV